MNEKRKKDNKPGPLLSLIIRWVTNAVAIAIAIWLIPGLIVEDTGGLTLLSIALIFGLVNAIIRPIVVLLTCPLLILTLGLGTLLINAGLFALTAWLAQAVGIGFTITGFWPAFWGALVVTIISAILSSLVGVSD